MLAYRRAFAAYNEAMITVIDNYDSFTYNLVQYLGEIGADIKVYRNDEIKADALINEGPKGILISPGPSDPDHAGICLDVIKLAAEKKIPLLGVCLGHQSIGQAFGGEIVRGQKPMHGKISTLSHTGKGVFEGIENEYDITRYHSLIIERETFPDDLEITAETDDGKIMGIQHKNLPIHGVQFHPESIATQHGHKLLENFVRLL